MSAIAKPVTTIINNALRKAGLEQRLVRDPSGYYYVTDVACSSALYAYRLARTKQDLAVACVHVNAVFAEEGINFHFNSEAVLVSHPVGYTGHLRACTNKRVPLSLDAWRRSFGAH